MEDPQGDRIKELQAALGRSNDAIREIADWLREDCPTDTAPCEHCLRAIADPDQP